MTIAAQWEQQSIEKSGAKALRRQIQAKFGSPGPAAEARIQAAEPAQLEQWVERILTANSPDEWFG